MSKDPPAWTYMPERGDKRRAQYHGPTYSEVELRKGATDQRCSEHPTENKMKAYTDLLSRLVDIGVET